MNGSIQKRGKQSWRLTIDLGRDENGNRKRKFVTVKGTKAQAQKQLRELLSSVDKGLPVDTSKATTGEFLAQWLKDYVESNTAPKTYHDYSGIVRRYVNPHLGQISLDKLTPKDIQALYRCMLADGLSARSVQYTHRVLREALSHAMKWGLLFRNVCDAVDPPRPRKKEMNTLDTSDVQRLLEATSQSLYGAVFYLALYTGLRRGEVLGLQWRDVNFQNRTLSVNRTVVQLPGKGLMVDEPKTAYSRRLVSLPPSAVALLRGLKIKLREQFDALGVPWDESAFIFCNADGGPIRPDTVTHSFKSTVEKLGLPNVRFHDLRHSHATLMLKQGV